MPLNVIVPPKDFAGVSRDAFTRNGQPANGQWMRNAIAQQINSLLAYHGPIIPPMSWSPEAARNSSSDLRLCTQYYRASVNGTTLVSTVRCIPTDTTAGNPRWYLKVDGVAQTSQYHNVRCASGQGTNFTESFEMVQEVTVTAGALRRIDLFTDDNCRVISWSLHEKPRSSLVRGTDTIADYGRILPLSPILDDDVASVRDAFDHVHDKMRGVHMAHHVDDPATPIAVSSTTPAYIFETGGTAGVVVPTQYRNTYANENLLGGVANKSVPCIAWMLAERTAGAGKVSLRFIGGNHAGGVDVECTGALAIWTATTFTELPAAAGDIIKTQKLVTIGGTTGNIFDFGLIPIIGT